MTNSSQLITFEQIMTQTITFMDSAYPNPHNLRECIWSGRLDDHGKLWFDLHLISEDYYANEMVAFDDLYFPKDWDLDKATIKFKKVLTDFEH